MKLFIDTEFADQTARELVSIAMVSQDGRFEFYAERDPLPVAPSDFVRTVVYPLLDRGDRSLTDDEMSKQLHAFFDRVKEECRHGQVLVAYDYVADIHLLDAALGGRDANTSARPLFNVFNLQLLGEEFNRTVERLFSCNGQTAARRHHALIDAWVNRDACMAVQRISSERSVQDVVGRDRGPRTCK
jgi:hypothetical protein